MNPTTEQYINFWSTNENQPELFESSDFLRFKGNWEKGEYCE